MDDACDRAMGRIADGIGTLFRRHHQLCHIGHELPGDRIIGIGAVNQCGNGRRQRDGITFRDRFQRRRVLPIDKRCPLEIVDCPDRSNDVHLPNSATGAQSTCSMRDAPVASITSRSKPRAMPLASGMMASASRKSSSSG